MHFRKLTLLILLGLLLACPPLRAASNIISCDTYSLRDLIEQDRESLETLPAVLKRIGIKGIAYNDIFFKSWDRPYLDALKRSARESGCKVVALIMEGDLASPNEAARNRQIETNLKKMEAAAYLGARVVRMNLGGSGNPQEDDTAGVERVIAAFKEMLPAARRLKVKMTIENHGGVSRTADNILRIIRETDPRWVGSCLDFGNWPDDTLYDECRKLAPYAYHTHAKAHSFKEDGEDSRLDFGRILRMLKAARYKNALSIEYEGGGDPVEGVRKTKELIMKHWEK
ncbi:MAG: sugar phosphate isomerase/epimerase [Armatimonadetes bacterium]|nr:sugar phosphate isomerase/epimerase [Armatimonadota bacterium]